MFTTAMVEGQHVPPMAARAYTERSSRRRNHSLVAADHGPEYRATRHDPSTGASPPDHLTALATRLAVELAGAGLGEDVATGTLRDRLGALRRLEGAVAVAVAGTVRALEQAGAVRSDGASSTTAWIAETSGVSRREASRIGRRASSLADLPATARSLAEGRISPATADEIITAARDGRLGSPEQVETALLPLAQGQRPERIRGEVRRRTQQADAAALLRDERQQHQRRRLSLTRRDDGMWDIHGQLPGQVGDRARTLLDVFDHADPPDTPPGRGRRPDQRLADAFATAVDVALDHGELPDSGGVSRPHVSVVVDVTTFEADVTDGDGTGAIAPDDPRWADLPAAETAWGTTLSPQAARQLCCDAGISRVLMAGPGQALDVGRATRDWSAAQRRAVNARDRSCRGPNCRRPIAWTQIHHLRWWRRGGRTDVGNGLALCSACHTLVHRDGWHPVLDPVTAAVTWRSPDRRRTEVTHPRPPD